MSKSQIINAKFGQFTLVGLMILPLVIPIYLMSIDDFWWISFLYSSLSLLPLFIAIRFKRAFHYAKIKNNYICSYGFFCKKLCDVDLTKPLFYAITPSFKIPFSTGQSECVVISNAPFEYVDLIENTYKKEGHVLSALLTKYNTKKIIWLDYNTTKKQLDFSQFIRIDRKLFYNYSGAYSDKIFLSQSVYENMVNRIISAFSIISSILFLGSLIHFGEKIPVLLLIIPTIIAFVSVCVYKYIGKYKNMLFYSTIKNDKITMYNFMKKQICSVDLKSQVYYKIIKTNLNKEESQFILISNKIFSVDYDDFSKQTFLDLNINFSKVAILPYNKMISQKLVTNSNWIAK